MVLLNCFLFTVDIIEESLRKFSGVLITTRENISVFVALPCIFRAAFLVNILEPDLYSFRCQVRATTSVSFEMFYSVLYTCYECSSALH
jgi:hypothetical protein